MSPAELRARMVAMHDENRVCRAEDGALFACALAVYEGACARRERAKAAIVRAEEELLEAIELEAEWCPIVHGLALRYARTRDRSDAAALKRNKVNNSE